MSAFTRRTLFASLAITASLGTAIAAEAQVNGSRETTIASLPAADAASDNVTFSQDNRIARLLAYDTAATNIVPGDTNGARDVMLVQRGTGATARVSVGAGGVQANGASSRPSIDGDGKRAPHCVAFESTASNLAAGDSSNDSDVFLRELRGGRTTLVSVGHTGARSAVVDGECDFVTYEASGRVFVRDIEAGKTTSLGSGSNPDQQTNGKGVAYQRGGQIYYQAFQKVNLKGGRGKKKGIKKLGRAVLASKGRSGSGNGASSNPVMDDNGFYVAFESTATNLCTGLCKGVSGDENGATSDVFRRTLSKRAPSRDTMQMVSFSFAANTQGNGPSNNPSMTGAGENIAFDSEATNLRQSTGITSIDPNGPIRDVYYWNFPRGRGFGNVSRESKPGPKGEFNGPSTNPGVSNRSNYIGFTSEQTGQSGEINGAEIADVFSRFMGGGPSDAD